MSGVLFRLLARGPGLWLEAGGRGEKAGTPKEQSLLAILLLSPNKAVSVDKISDHVWDESPCRASRETIERYVTKIRGRLRGLFGDRVKIIGKQGTYRLETAPETIDVHLFDLRRREAIAAERQGCLERAIKLYREAEGLFDGEPLSGFTSAWAREVRQDLEEKFFQVRKRRTALQVRLGRYDEVLDELADLVEQRPDDHVLVGNLMTALAATGRRADALKAYRRHRDHLVETQGIEPDRSLRELQRRILQGDGDVTGAGRRKVPGPCRLPADIPHFVGRKAELEQVGIVLADRPGGGVVVIEGMPGVGKTALAVHAAHRLAADYPDAQLYLDLKAHDRTSPPLTPRVAITRLLAMLGDTQARPSLSLDELSARWRARMADSRALLVLDDAAGLEQVRPLLPADPEHWDGLVIVTTRDRVEPRGVRRIPLGTLAADEVAEMWHHLTGERLDPALRRRLWSGCAGLPLAVEALARRGGVPGGDPHRPIREVCEAVERSYRRLTPERQRAFRRLGLLPGDDTAMDVATQVIDPTAQDPRAEIAALARSHLVDLAGEGATERVRLHPLIRAAAAELARNTETTGDIRALGSRVLRHYLRTAEADDGALFPHRWRMISLSDRERFTRPTVADAFAWFEAEWRTILSLAKYAAEHEWQAECADLMHLVAEYLDFRGRHAEAAEGHERAVRACRDIGDRLGRARALLDLAFARFRTANCEEAVNHLWAAQRIFSAERRPREIGRCLELHGLVRWSQEEHRRALALFEDAEEYYRKAGDRKGVADTLRHKGMAKWSTGRYPDAERLFDEALGIYRELGDRIGEMKALTGKGHVAQHMARHRDADRLFRESSAIYRELTGEENHAILDHNQGDLHKYKRRYETALECYERALCSYRSAGNRRYEAEVLNAMGEACLGLGRTNEALEHFKRAQRLAEEISCRSQLARALVGLADIDRELGRHEDATRLYMDAHNLARTIDDLRQLALIIDRLAHVRLDEDHRDEARWLWWEARYLYRQIGLHAFAEEIDLKLKMLGDRAFDDK